MKKITRCLFAITTLKSSDEIGPRASSMGFEFTGGYHVHLLDNKLYDTISDAIFEINEKGYIYAIVQEVYMTFSEDQWEIYDNDKEQRHEMPKL